MAYWQESESIHFDWVLYDMFETWIEYDEAFYEWSDVQWIENFKEKLVQRDFTEDIKSVVESEFLHFIDYRREGIKREQEESEKQESSFSIDTLIDELIETVEQRINEEDYELEQSRKRAEENRLVELKAREKRKAKQLPEVLSLIERYQNIKAEIQKDVSVDTYETLFNVCYSVISNWGIVGCLDEFHDVWEYYEQRVLEYYENHKSINSLLHVVFYYTKDDIVWKISNLSDRKAHILKGLPYVQGLYEITEFEEDAKRYLDVYGMLRTFCSSGEDLEALRYATKEYKLAKKFAFHFQTDDMLEALDRAKLGMTVCYRMHDQEEEAVKIEKETEEIITQIRSQREEDGE
ncbi:MAG: hypothetical protein J6A75_02640 [Lachnospiraceae bacterium]|nr:hypothetical protein [Lachnospiraceae bacterium]